VFIFCVIVCFSIYIDVSLVLLISSWYTVDVAVFMLIHVAIFVGTIDRPLSLNLLGFHVIIGLNPGSFSARTAEGEISIKNVL